VVIKSNIPEETLAFYRENSSTRADDSYSDWRAWVGLSR